MSQYGQVSANYYLPKPKFNTLRLIYKYVNFEAFESFVTSYCLFEVIYPLLTGSLSPISIEGSCITPALTKINTGDFNPILTGINSCELDYVQPTNLITRITNFISATIYNSCALTVTNNPIAPLTPTGSTTIDNWCNIDLQYISPTGTLNPIIINNSCSSPASIKINTGEFIPILTGISSCGLNYVQPTNLITRVELTSRIVNVNNACEVSIT